MASPKDFTDEGGTETGGGTAPDDEDPDPEPEPEPEPEPTLDNPVNSGPSGSTESEPKPQTDPEPTQSDRGNVPDDLTDSGSPESSDGETNQDTTSTEDPTPEPTPEPEPESETTEETKNTDPDPEQDQDQDQDGPIITDGYPDQPEKEQETEDTQGGEDGIATLEEEYYVESRDHLDGEDVKVEFKDGGSELKLTESGAEAQYAKNNEGVSESDVRAERSGDEFDISLTESGAEAQFVKNNDGVTESDIQAKETADGFDIQFTEEGLDSEFAQQQRAKETYDETGLSGELGEKYREDQAKAEVSEELGVGPDNITAEEQDDGSIELGLTEDGAEERAREEYAENRDNVDPEDVIAQQQDDGTVDLDLTDEAAERVQEQAIEDNYERGPTGASEKISGEQGIADDGSPNDPLEGSGLESGFGATADLARELERRTVADTDGVERDDIEVTAEDGKLRVDMDRGTLTPEQAENIDETLQEESTKIQQNQTEIEQDPSQLQQESGPTVSSDVEEEQSGKNTEQFGDIDWSFGMGDPNKDEVEQFIDNKLGEGGSEFVQENVGTPLRKFGESAKNADLFGAAPEKTATERALNNNYDSLSGGDGEATADNDSGVGPGEAVGNLALGAANIAEEAPRLPGAALEGVEGANYLLEGTTVAGGSEEEFDERASEAGAFAAAVAKSEADRARNKPGTVAAEALLGAGLGRAVSASRLSPSNPVDTSAARQTIGKYTPDSRGRSNAGISDFVADKRAQADFGTQTKQKTLYRDKDDADSATTLDEMEEEGIVNVQNRDTSTELSDVEAEAREQLPDADEYPSQAEFDRELTQQMRRIEKGKRSNTKQKQEQSTTQKQTQSTAVGGGVGAGAVATEVSEFRSNQTGTAEQMAATGVAGEGTTAETVATVTEPRAVDGVSVGSTTSMTDTAAVTETKTSPMSVQTTATVADQTAVSEFGTVADQIAVSELGTEMTTGVTETTSVSETEAIGESVQTTGTISDQVAVQESLMSTPTTTKNRKRDLGLGGDNNDDVLLGGEPEGEQQRYEYDSVDLL